MGAAHDAEVLEALIRSEMARVSAFKPAADRGSYDAKNARTWLLGRLDALFDEHALLTLGVLVEALDSDELCEGA